MADSYIKVSLEGRIDSNNAAEAEKNIQSQLDGKGAVPVELDAGQLEYISSAGLRILLRLKKNYPELKITGVNAAVYDILEMTGFTEMMTVEKAYRVVSVEGCEEIGRGSNGTIYRIDQNNVVKVYNNADALEDIRHEREVARLALILGIPTAISYDVVKVGSSYGSVFELLNARSFSKIPSSEPDKMDWCVKEFVNMLRKIHSTEVPAGKLPDMRETVLDWAALVQKHLPEEAGKKLLALVREIPHDDHMIHGDYHTKNLELQNDEVLLIDMDTLAIGHPLFELGSIYNAFIGFSEYDHENIKRFQGFDFETSCLFWHKALAAYLETDNPAKIKEVENKARIIGYIRLIRRSIKRRLYEPPNGKAAFDLWKGELLELLDKVDTLLFTPDELEVEAVTENLVYVQDFMEQRITAAGCSAEAKMQISIAVEEIFVNIINYAYHPKKGSATIRAEVSSAPVTVTITFTDRGVPYDPLAKEDPDITLSAQERQIGGLGIFMTKKLMDNVTYEYKDGRNILTLKKITD